MRNIPSITYIKNGKEKVLFEIENPYFVISDEKYGFCDLLYMDELKQRYKTKEKTDEELLKLFEQECRSFFRICIFDEKRDVTKLLHSTKKQLYNAKPDNEYLDFSIFLNTEYDQQAISLPFSGVDLLIEQVESGDNTLLLNTLKQMKSAVEDMELAEEEEKQSEQEQLNYELKSLDDELNSLIGLKEIKEFVLKLKSYLEYLNKVEGKVNLEKPNLNMLFKGNPGTGKTTIARIISKIIYKLGFSDKANFAETTAQDFIAEYVGQTAVKSRKLIEANRGGTIFIDEAYVFAGKGQEFAQEALVEIIKEMESKKTNFIFAGYNDEMEDFMNMNPGLRSRIENKVEFKDYNALELYEILDRKIKKSRLKIGEAPKRELIKIIKNNITKEHFGNGRFIDNLFDIFYNKNSCKIFGLVIREDLLPEKYTYNEKFEISNKKSAHLTKSTIHNNKEYLYIFKK